MTEQVDRLGYWNNRVSNTIKEIGDLILTYEFDNVVDLIDNLLNAQTSGCPVTIEESVMEAEQYLIQVRQLSENK